MVGCCESKFHFVKSRNEQVDNAAEFVKFYKLRRY